MKTRLSININKVALIRNSRGDNFPDLLKFAKDCEEFGAEGITVHPRPDERHIRYSDLAPLKEQTINEFNIEGYPSTRFVKEVLAVKPDQVTLVPDKPGALTSSEGWDTIKDADLLKEVIGEFRANQIRVSLFLDPVRELLEGAKACGTDRIELYTGKYAKEYSTDRERAIMSHIEISKHAAELELGLNAGHDLNLKNLNFYKISLYNLAEVSIGHAIVVDSLYYGIQNTIQMYLHQINK